MTKSPPSSPALQSGYTPEQSRDAVNYPQSVSWNRLMLSKPRSMSASSTYVHPDSPSATPSSAAATSASPASLAGLNTSRPKQRYGYAKINAKAMDECRELYRTERAALRAYKNAYYDRIEALANVKAFREKHGLDADTFQKYGSGRNGRRPLPE
jgi:hypothetical protein